MTRTEALRKVYKKVTNEEAPVTANTITEVLVALADKYSGDEPVTANTITDALVALADNYEGGGGGSSDFSTATVTVVNNTNIGVNILGALIDHDAINSGMIIAENDTHAIEAVLYKAEGLIVVDDEEATITVSGDAELDETAVIITGDCTITIS